MRTKLLLAILILTLGLVSCGQPVIETPATAASSAPEIQADAEVFAQFEEELEYLRQALKIPGMSAAIVQDQELVWAKGFGYADLENQVEATPDTPYLLASVTKPIAATLLMQLVEEGVLDLEDPVSDYGVELEGQGVIQVYHLLTHTSEGVPGTHHNYSGHRYGFLTQVAEAATGQSFTELLSERILEPLDMSNSGPNFPQSKCNLDNPGASLTEREKQFARVYRELAKPYQLDQGYKIIEGGYGNYFGTSAGLISTVVDLAKFDIALDQNILLSPETKAQMFAPAFSTHGNSTELMYGLGWYVQQYEGTRLLWHTGRNSPSVSALYVKVPDESLTFIILANTANLSTPYPLGDGDVLYSTLALTFYETFVFPQQFGKRVPRIDWEADEQDVVNQLRQIRDRDVRQILERELWSYRQLFANTGRRDLTDRLVNVRRKALAGTRSPTPDLDRHLALGVEQSAPVEERVVLSETELVRFAGQYRLSQAPEIEGFSPPSEVRIGVYEGDLVACVPDDAPLTLVPIAPTRFRAVGGLNGTIYVEVNMNGEKAEGFNVELSDTLALVYEAEDPDIGGK
jgi:CubicO group peptidase (beta-lactamase class C family)